MPTPFLPVDYSATGSVSVQNRNDAAGVLSTYLIVRQGATKGQMQFRTLGRDDYSDVTFKLERTLIGNLTAALGFAFASSATGSFGSV